MLSAAIQTNRELIQRMESNFVRFQTEIANKLQNPTLGNNDKEVGKGKGIVHQNNNGGTRDNLTDQFDGKGENENPYAYYRKLPQALSQGTMGIVHQKNNGGTEDNYADQFDGKGENETPYDYSHKLSQAPSLQKGRERKGDKRKETVQQQLTEVQTNL